MSRRSYKQDQQAKLDKRLAHGKRVMKQRRKRVLKRAQTARQAASAQVYRDITQEWFNRDREAILLARELRGLRPQTDIVGVKQDRRNYDR
jgi:hypothetical protein